MSRRVRVPGLIDIVQVDEPAAIRLLSVDPRLDRGYQPVGPLFNRLLTSRIVRMLSLDGKPLPIMRARGDRDRTREQATLAAKLDAGRDLWGADAIEQLAACVRGDRQEQDFGILAQQVVGRLFKDDYRATDETWRAACRLDAAVRSRNPIAWLAEALSGRARQARERLAAAVGGDRAGVHATGIAVHNLVAGLGRMRADYADPGWRGRLGPEAAAVRSLVAPEGVLRQATMPADTVVGSLKRGALVVLELEAAARARVDPHLAFLDRTWSACPASGFVIALLAAVWARATQVPEPVS